MLAAIRIAGSLLKLRIGVAVAASALAGMAAAQGPLPSAGHAMALALAVLGAAGAAGAFNHYFDRDIDARMARTRARPFASGVLRPGLVWPVTFLALLAAALALAYAAGGGMAALYTFLGAFTYGAVYTVWLKRRTVWNIVVGGLAGSFAVLAGAAAVDPSPQPVPVILAIVLFLWTPPHFWSLAGAQRDAYAAAGIPMLPLVVPDRAWTAAVLAHTAALVALSLLPLWYGMGPLYAGGAATGGALFLWTSWRLWAAPGKRTAMANFVASLFQLMLLVAGVLLEAALGPLPWPA